MARKQTCANLTQRVRVDDRILDTGTPLTFQITKKGYKCVVIGGQHQGLCFTLNAQAADLVLAYPRGFT